MNANSDGQSWQQSVAHVVSPEEEELRQKRAELAEAQADLLQRELDLATLRGRLSAFHSRYVREVFVKYSELDAIEAETARLVAQRSPGDPAARHRADEAEAAAQESAKAANEAYDDERQSFTPSPDLKALYRDVAKQVHPDLAGDDGEREYRARVMAEVNEAYAAGDVGRLRSILEDWRHRPESVQGQGVAVELVRVIRKLSLARKRIQTVQRELAELMQGELYDLMRKAHDAEREGRNLLRELAAMVDGRINQARQRLAELRRQ